MDVVSYVVRDGQGGLDVVNITIDVTLASYYLDQTSLPMARVSPLLPQPPPMRILSLLTQFCDPIWWANQEKLRQQGQTKFFLLLHTIHVKAHHSVLVA